MTKLTDQLGPHGGRIEALKLHVKCIHNHWALCEFKGKFELLNNDSKVILY
jgi:hypothetical protein